jgi:uncharacterized protein (DUF305 family)
MNTTNKIIISVLIGLSVGVGGTIAFSKADSDNSREDTQHEMATGQMMGGGSMGMQDEMGAMNGMLQGKTGDTFDKAFLSEMIVHHQGAVVMAQEALKNAKHQEIKDLAQNIITAQNKEIAEMQAWQVAWYGSTKSSSSP